MIVPDRSDRVAFAAHGASVMQGWANGARVEVKENGDSEWTACPDPRWNWLRADYRLAPEAPKVEPWTFETVPAGSIIKRKSDGHRSVITSCGQCGARVGSTKFDYDVILRDFEQLDGSPCGTVKVSEWPKWFDGCSGDVWRMDSEDKGVFYGREGIEEEAGPSASYLAKYYKQIPPAEAEALIEKARAGK